MIAHSLTLVLLLAIPVDRGGSPQASGGIPLAKHELRTRTSRLSLPSGYFDCEHEHRLRLADVTDLCYAAARAHPGAILQLAPVPGRPGSWVFVASGRSGLQLVLASWAGGRLTEADRTRGAGDAYSLRPAFFTGGGRTFVFVESAKETSRGFLVLELAGGRLREVAPLEVALDADDSSALPQLSARLQGRELQVSFDADLVKPGAGTEYTRSGGAPVVFRHDGKRFVRTR